MEFTTTTATLESLQSACVITGIYENQELTASAATMDKLTNGIISNLLERCDFEGKIAETLIINVIPDSTIERILLIGLGSIQALSPKNYRKVVTGAIKHLKASKASNAFSTLMEIDVDGFDAQ